MPTRRNDGFVSPMPGREGARCLMFREGAGCHAVSTRGYDDVIAIGLSVDQGFTNNIGQPSCAGGHGGPPLRRGFASKTTTCIQYSNPTAADIRTIFTLVSQCGETRTNSASGRTTAHARDYDDVAVIGLPMKTVGRFHNELEISSQNQRLFHEET